MPFRQLAALTFVALFAATAQSQVNDVYDPAEVASTTVHARTPVQVNPERIAATLLDTRASLINGPGAGPGGADLSILQNVSLGLTIFGFGSNQASGIFLAEDFVVPAGGWTIDKITTYMYQTGSTTTSTMTGLYLQIWNGPPDAGGTVVFGDTTTNRLTSSLWTGAYRVAENASTSTTRPIMANEAAGLNWVLPAGTYWLQWGATGSLASGPWTVPFSINGQTTTGNVKQLNGGIWSTAVDASFPQGVAMTLSAPDLPGVTVTETAGSTDVNEGGAPDTFDVVLATAPTADVTVTLTPNAQVAVGAPALTFTPLNWNVAQSVTVSAVDDAVAEGNHTGSIAFVLTSADAGYNGLSVPSLSVNVADNDTAGVTLTPTTISATEGGATGNFTVVLTSQPTADVSITVTPDAQSTVSSGTLTFTALNWNVAQTVTVTAVDDAVVEGAHVSTITTGATVSTDPNYSGLTVADVTVNITDNDSAGISVTPTTISAAEGGATGTFNVVLTSQPSANVTISVVADTQSTLSTGSLTFTPANWNVPQAVVVTAVDDGLIEGAHVSNIITGAAVSTDPGYSGLAVADVTVNITDNDAVGATVVQSSGSTAVSESGVADTISIVLNAQPAANVTITLAGAGQLGLSPNPLVFTPANWNVAQFVTVSAIDDAIVEGPHAATITFTVTSTDASFNGMPIAGIPVSILDNDLDAARVVPVFGPIALGALLLLLAGFGVAGRRLRAGRAPR